MTTRNLKLITWNVWFSDKFQVDRIKAIIQEIHSNSPDVACLQEITMPILDLISKFVDKSKYTLWFDAYSVNPYGQIFIVRKNIPVTAFGSHAFPDTRMNRRIYYLTLAGQTTILNVHLESEFSGDPNSNKAKQLDYLLRFAKQHFGNHNIFIAGDFNLAPQDDTWSKQTIDTNGFLDISPKNVGYTFDYTINTNISRPYQSNLDRILSNIPVVQVYHLLGKTAISPSINVFPSDHFGIFMNLHKFLIK